MATSNELFNNAELSLAAYAVLQNITTPASTSSYLQQLKDAGMSETEATQFAIRYPTILSVATDPISGFQATVFSTGPAGNPPNQTTVAIRGTQPTSPADISEDISIIMGGTALDQVLSMVNWWQEVTAAQGADINHYSVEWSQIKLKVPEGLFFEQLCIF